MHRSAAPRLPDVGSSVAQESAVEKNRKFANEPEKSLISIARSRAAHAASALGGCSWVRGSSLWTMGVVSGTATNCS